MGFKKPTPKDAMGEDMSDSVEDKAAPAKKKKGKAEKKKAGPKLVAAALKMAGEGHNRGQLLPELVALMDEDLALEEQKKAIGKAQRDIRNKVKTEYGVQLWNWNYEKQQRKVAKDVRIQRESGQVDLKVMLGYQLDLDLKSDTVARTEEEFVDPANKTTVETIQREG